MTFKLNENQGAEKKSGAGKAPADDNEKAIDNIKEVERELKAQKRIRIMIPSTEEQQEPVAVGVNGYTFLIARDKEVDVPEAVVEVLKNAKLTTYKQIKREDSEGYEMIPITSLRHAYQIL